MAILGLSKLRACRAAVTADEEVETMSGEMRPNIVLINCDDLGYGDLGCYGSRVNRTPAIDRLAAEGLRLTDFYMASPVCSPSRGAMLTGCYPPRIGFGSFDGDTVLFPGHALGLNPGETTLAQLLREAGYRTKLVGKWHCGDQPEFLPTRHGFDSYYGLPYSNDMGRQAGWEHRPPLPLLADERVIEQQPDQRSLTERYVEEATGFIHEQREGPFFLYLAHMHVHLPYYAPEHFERESQNGLYGACVEALDWATARILWQLEEDGIDLDTLVIFTSDNGSRGDRGGSNLPLRGAKASTWEGGQRVPCILRWPGHIAAGQTSGEIVAAIDFLPTLCALAGTQPRGDRPIDGIDVSPWLLGRRGESGRGEFFYYWMNDLEAVRSGRWKLHVSKHGTACHELYDLGTDIGETVNLASEEPAVVSRLEARLEAMRGLLGDDRFGRPGCARRPAGRVPHPRPLTVYDESHPYIIALYDRGEVG